ncbi:MAG: nucleotidyltransferase domain-containing protein [Deltaproteobacteria bacterium]|nr:nucleotidyltransferase domain-containing protein [Deltaproteobacteria bacterium]
MTICLNPRHYQKVLQIINKYRSLGDFYVFGSRATGQASKFSDLDILILGKESINIKNLSALERDFSESSLPFRVDIVDAHRVSASFLKTIIKNKKKI